MKYLNAILEWIKHLLSVLIDQLYTALGSDSSGKRKRKKKKRHRSVQFPAFALKSKRKEGRISLEEDSDLYFRYHYPKQKEFSALDPKTRANLKNLSLFTEYKGGYYEIHYMYREMLRDFLNLHPEIRTAELACVPDMTGEKNPFTDLIADLAADEDLGAYLLDASLAMFRIRRLKDRENSDNYSAGEHYMTLRCGRPLKTDTVILLDGIYEKGHALKGCEHLLRDVGVKYIYKICLYKK